MRLRLAARTTSYALEPDYSVPLARLFQLESGHGETSGFLSIHNNDEALAWRIALIENAKKSIDAQYYCWHADTSGKLLISKLIEAADRGVRVRLLLDDVHTFGEDRRIAILNRHRNIEVRIFNPFGIRWPVRLIRLLEFLWKFDRLNHRMHNKLLIADNMVSIIGGRNVGDEYFGLDPKFVFRDLDLLVCGESVQKFSYSFDLYWNSAVSKMARRLIPFRPGRLDFRHMKKRLQQHVLQSQQIIQRVNNLKDKLINNPSLATSLIKSDAMVVYDLPEFETTTQIKMVQTLYQCSADTSNLLTIISAYFVPSEQLIGAIQNLIERGVRVQVLTNSLASIDVTAVFSGYQRYRRQLLDIGVEIYEFRAMPEYHSVYSTPAINVNSFGLHAKSIVYDTQSVYVGTLNLDPRSETLNTEIGILVNSPALANSVRSAFLDDVSEGEFWHVTYNQKAQLTWSCGTEQTTTQPARSLWQRLANLLYSMLPIQHQL